MLSLSVTICGARVSYHPHDDGVTHFMHLLHTAHPLLCLLQPPHHAAFGCTNSNACCSRLIQSQQSRARRHLFLAERESARPSMVAQVRTPPRVSKIQKVGIIGAGTMGSGIAIAHLMVGIEVQLRCCCIVAYVHTCIHATSEDDWFRGNSSLIHCCAMACGLSSHPALCTLNLSAQVVLGAH